MVVERWISVSDWEKEGPPCIHCGKSKADHCEYEPAKVPDGCVCDPMEWGNPLEIPEICDNFTEDNDTESDCYDPERCISCEHDKACHENRDKLMKSDPIDD